MSRVQILFNSASGRYAPAIVAGLAAAFRRRGAVVTLTGTGQAPPVIAPVDHVCVVGGDGTLRHVAHALAALPAPPRLSVFPGGTVNLIAREWPGGRCVETFAGRVLAAGDRTHFAVTLDAGGDSGGLFLACAGAGWESAAVAGVDAGLKRRIGRLAYAVAALRLLWRWTPPAIRLVADGQVIACGGFHIAKGVHYAGRWRLGSRGFGAEPVMEVVALTRARRRDLLRFWWTLARGRPVAALPHVTVVVCAMLTAEADRPWPVQADGDPVGHLPMTFTVAAVPLVLC